MKIFRSSIVDNIWRIAVRVSGLYSRLPTSADRIIHVSPRGNDANDGLTWGTAKLTIVGGLAALPGPGKILIGGGSVSTGGEVDLEGRIGVAIEGLGGVTPGALPATTVVHSGAGAGSVFNLRDSFGCKLKGFQVIYTNAGFTGRVIDTRSITGGSPALNVFEDLYVGGTPNPLTAAAGIDLSNSHTITIRNCNIVGNQVGIRGRTVVGDFANTIVITGTRFGNNAVAHIQNIGEGWTIGGCTFEPLQSGAAGAMQNNLTGPAGLAMFGNWLGDVVGGVGGTQLALGAINGAQITGNFIGFNDGAVGVSVGAGSRGFNITGNTFESGGTSQGIAITAPVSGFDVSNNTYVSVSNPTGAFVEQRQTPGADTATTFQWTNNAGGVVMNVNTANGRVGVNNSAPVATLHVSGGLSLGFLTRTTGPYAPLTTDHTIACNATTGAFTVNLPSAGAVGSGRMLVIKKVDASANAVTVAAAGGQTIDGAASRNLAAQWDTLYLVSDGSVTWLRIFSI